MFSQCIKPNVINFKNLIALGIRADLVAFLQFPGPWQL